MKVANVATVITQARTAIVESRAPLRSQTSFWVPVREAFWNALGELRSHKLRSFLTLLGVVIATTTLIVVMSVVNGMNLYIATKIANLGTNTFVLSSVQVGAGLRELFESAAAQQAHPPRGIRVSAGDAARLRGHERHRATAIPAPRRATGATRSMK